MEHIGPAEVLLSAGAIAALLLVFAGRRLPQSVCFVPAIIAVAAVFAGAMMTVSFGAVMLFAFVFSKLGVAGDGAGWLGIGLASLFRPVISPASYFLGNLLGRFGAMAFDAAYWRWLEVMAVCAIMPLSGRLALPAAVERLRSRLEQGWPDGRFAILSTAVAALWFGAVPFLLHPGPRAILVPAIGVAVIAMLRVRQPRLASWGAWVIAMASLPLLILRLAIPLMPGPAAYPGSQALALQTVATALAAAILILIGPRRALPAKLWPWLTYAVLVVLPGLGWLTQPFVFK